jgi:asparagine synthase (glutamine-hydrolysing)
MTDALAHRGPDDRGIWAGDAAGIALGHRRLAIVDLSAHGHQPMPSASGRYVVTYNGELYNYLELKRELSGYPYRGASDTEVVLAACEAWGVERALARFDGMFALGVWDVHERSLVLARDRFGEKPLYYGLSAGCVIFGSELRALEAFPHFARVLDRGALGQFLRFGYVPTPSCIFEGVRKLPAASYLRITTEQDVSVAPTLYWDYGSLVQRARQTPFLGSDTDAVAELDVLLRRVVGSRLMADVPVGAFLSGGIDSSAIVATMQAGSARRARTFTIGFEEAMFNEAQSARAVAAHLGTDHTELYVSPAQAMTVIPDLPDLYDEPFADSSQIPTVLVSRLARQNVTVSLSGDGGDELFGGYNRYVWAERIWNGVGSLPMVLRQGVAEALERLQPRWIDRASLVAASALRRPVGIRNPGDKLQKLARALRAPTARDLYLDLVSTWKHPDKVTGLAESRHALLPDFGSSGGDFVDDMMRVDGLTYLPDDILVKVDRASMSVALEARVPFLSAELATFAWSLPRQMKIRRGRGKWILREVLAKYVPRALFERPKMGFGVPLASWLRGPLRAWAEDALDERRLSEAGFLAPAPVRDLWNEHQSGRRNHQHELWHVLMFQSWAARHRPV